MSAPSRKRAAPDDPQDADDTSTTTGVADFFADVEAGERLAPLLAKVRQGMPAARKQAMRQLVVERDVRPLLEAVLNATDEPEIDPIERHRLIKLAVRIVQRPHDAASRAAVTAATEPLLRLSQTLLLGQDRLIHSMGQELLTSLARVVGLKALLTALRPEFDTGDDRVRLACAASLASVSLAFGISLLVPLLRALTADEAQNVRLLGMLTLRRLAGQGGSSILPFLSPLVECCLGPLAEPHLSSAACAALRAFAEAVSPFGIEAFEPALPLLWKGVRRRHGRPASAFLRTLAALVTLVDPAEAADFTSPLINHAVKDYDSPDEEVRRAALLVTQLCMPSARPEQALDLMAPLFERFWTPEVANDGDHRLATLVVRTTSGLPVELSTIVMKLVSSNVLVSDSAALQTMGLNLLSQLGSGTLLLDRRIEERLIDGLVVMPPSPTPASFAAASNVAQSLGPERLGVHARAWVQSLIEQQANPDAGQRALSALIMRALAPQLPASELGVLQRCLPEQLGEELPEVLSELMNAMAAVVTASEDALDPPASTLLPRLLPILRNRNEKVQEACIRLVNKLAELDGESVSAREWINVCFELLQLQASYRVTVRRLATSTFAAIAAIIGPQDVVANLLGQLRANDRQLRVTSAAAIAAVGAHTGAFTILPIVMNEYRSQRGVVQQGVLKILAFLFEFLDKGQAPIYIESVVSLVDHALVQQSQVHRQTAASIVQHAALGCIGQGKEDVFLHFLNELMPSVFETSPHVIDRVLEAIEAISLVLGAATVANYLWAGLFHPARKVRTVYWKIWNQLYVLDSGALVPVYPLKVPSLDDADEDIRDVWV